VNGLALARQALCHLSFSTISLLPASEFFRIFYFIFQFQNLFSVSSKVLYLFIDILIFFSHHFLDSSVSSFKSSSVFKTVVLNLCVVDLLSSLFKGHLLVLFCCFSFFPLNGSYFSVSLPYVFFFFI
jgi:hypothetical protein